MVRQLPQVAPADRQVGRPAQVEVEFATHFSGPIPPPELLGQYDAILPGAADRILAMAEKQSSHRQAIETRVIRGNVRAQTVGQWMGFAIVLAALGGGIWLLSLGRSLEGFSTMFVPLGALSGIFVWYRGRQDRERGRKQAELQGEDRPQGG